MQALSPNMCHKIDPLDLLIETPMARKYCGWLKDFQPLDGILDSYSPSVVFLINPHLLFLTIQSTSVLFSTYSCSHQSRSLIFLSTRVHLIICRYSGMSI